MIFQRLNARETLFSFVSLGEEILAGTKIKYFNKESVK